MPWKPEKPCKYPGCPRTTSGRYCAVHQRIENQKRRECNRQYDSRWEKIRNLYIARHPLCELCEAAGRLVPAEEVHHKLPLADGGSHEDSNLQALCKPCHSRLTLAASREPRLF